MYLVNFYYIAVLDHMKCVTIRTCSKFYRHFNLIDEMIATQHRQQCDNTIVVTTFSSLPRVNYCYVCVTLRVNDLSVSAERHENAQRVVQVIAAVAAAPA